MGTTIELRFTQLKNTYSGEYNAACISVGMSAELVVARCCGPSRVNRYVSWL